LCCPTPSNGRIWPPAGSFPGRLSSVASFLPWQDSDTCHWR
jgi:hypothetical protein